MARRKIIVKCLPTSASILPCLISTLKLVAKRNLLWVCKAQRGIVNLQIAGVRWKGNNVGCTVTSMVGNNVLNMYGRWYGVASYVGRVNRLQTRVIGEP